MNISLQNIINVNNSVPMRKCNYKHCSRDIYFGSLKANAFIPNKDIYKQEKLMKQLAGAVFNPKEKDFYTEYAIDQRRLAQIIKKLTKNTFEPVLDSKQAIQTLLNQNFTRNDILLEYKNILNKVFEGKVCTGFDAIAFARMNETRIQKIQEKHALKLNPANEKYETAKKEFEDFQKDYLRQIRKARGKIAKLKRLNPNERLIDFQEQINEQKDKFIRIKIEYRKTFKIKYKALKSAKRKLSRIEEKTGIALYKQLPNTTDNGQTVVLLGKVYESLAAKEVNRIIIPNIAKDLAKEENKAEEEILKQLSQIRNVKFGPVEIDHLIVRINPDSSVNKNGDTFGGLVDYDITNVVGIVETKYNPNNLCEGFKKRIKNLKWLKGNYIDPENESYTKLFTSKTYYDEKTDVTYHFTPDSFKRFSTDVDKKQAYENIYFVTTNKPFIKLGKKILNSPDLNIQEIPNNIAGKAQKILKKYNDYGLWEKIVITNDDYCGYTLHQLLFFIKFRNAIIKTQQKLFEYQELPNLIA